VLVRHLYEIAACYSLNLGRIAALLVEITDTGPGIRADLLDRLFVPFDRLGAEAGPEQGAGLGLALARGLTEAMGGQLSLESGRGPGTTAALSLPSGKGGDGRR